MRKSILNLDTLPGLSLHPHVQARKVVCWVLPPDLGLYKPISEAKTLFTIAYAAQVSWCYRSNRNETSCAWAENGFTHVPHPSQILDVRWRPARCLRSGSLSSQSSLKRVSHITRKQAFRSPLGRSTWDWVLRNYQRKVFKVCCFPPMASHSHLSDSGNITHREAFSGQFSKGTQSRYNFAGK